MASMTYILIVNYVVYGNQGNPEGPRTSGGTFFHNSPTKKICKQYGDI